MQIKGAACLQWCGNLVTMAWWNDLWLNEASATNWEYFGVSTLLKRPYFPFSSAPSALSKHLLEALKACRSLHW
jgi:hypothetical protein